MTQVITTKVWLLLGDISRDDLDMFLRTKVEVNMINHEPIELSTYMKSFNVMSNRKPEIRVTTTREEDEIWLKLYFGNRLELFSSCTDFIS